MITSPKLSATSALPLIESLSLAEKGSPPTYEESRVDPPPPIDEAVKDERQVDEKVEVGLRQVNHHKICQRRAPIVGSFLINPAIPRKCGQLRRNLTLKSKAGIDAKIATLDGFAKMFLKSKHSPVNVKLEKTEQSRIDVYAKSSTGSINVELPANYTGFLVCDTRWGSVKVPEGARQFRGCCGRRRRTYYFGDSSSPLAMYKQCGRRGRASEVYCRTRLGGIVVTLAQ